MEGKEVVLVEGKLTKIVHQEGEGELPVKGQEIFALYKGTLQDGTLFDSNEDRQNPFNFVLGQGRVIKGWDQGFASMKKGEKATLVCSPEYAYGANGSPPKIPPNATLNFEVELLDFKDKKKEKWEYSDEEKMAEASNFKLSGNENYKKGHFKEAVASYKEAIEFIQHEHSPEAKQLLNVLRLNISQGCLKINAFADAVDHCSKVLKEEPENLKALYRRGVAYSKLQEFEKAKTDIKELLRLDPNNGDAKKELMTITAAVKQFEQKEKKVFGNIFSKAGLYDDVKTELKPEVKKVESDSEQEAKPAEGEAAMEEEKPAAENKPE